MTVKAHLTGTEDLDAQDRGLFEGVKEAGAEALDFFGFVDHSDVANNTVDTEALPRADKIELLVDGKTASTFSSSPWSVGIDLDKSVADAVHANKGATLVFGIKAGLIDALESKARSVRFALVWDDSIKSETGTLDVSLLGQTFLVVGLADEPRGQRLTLWLTDDDLQASLLREGRLQDLETIRKDVIGDIGAAADKGDGGGNPLSFIGDAFNKVGGFLTATQIGGVVALAVVGVVLIVIIKSNAATELAKNTKAIL